MPRLPPEFHTPSELTIPEDQVGFQLTANSQLQLESDSYGSAVVYGSPARWVPVYSAEGLQAAIVSGVAHIEIQSHLDLTALKPPPGSDYLFGLVPSTVKSITVRTDRILQKLP